MDTNFYKSMGAWILEKPETAGPDRTGSPAPADGYTIPEYYQQNYYFSLRMVYKTIKKNGSTGSYKIKQLTGNGLMGTIQSA